MSDLAPTASEESRCARPPLEVAKVFLAYGAVYRRSHPLPPAQHKVMRAIERCRTAALGGHVERCQHCNFERIAYNSCRNRHCPKCQTLAKEEWLQARRAELLPVGYFHNVFTLPHELNPLVPYNQKLLYDLLFRAVAETLHEFALDPRHGLGGRIGFTAVLHTWDQLLRQHIHLHCLIPAGVLSGAGTWIHARSKYLFPVRALSRLFRGKFIAFLKHACADGKLVWPCSKPAPTPQVEFTKLIRQLWHKEWIVYSKPPFGGPTQVLAYLGRYTHRVAISNNRLRGLTGGAVTFSYRDRRDGNTRKTAALPADEFIRRFLLHVLPNGYMRIRHFGFLANRHKQRMLGRCREALSLSAALPPVVKKTVQAWMLQLTGKDVTQCPRCKCGVLQFVMLLRPAPTPPLLPRQDSS